MIFLRMYLILQNASEKADCGDAIARHYAVRVGGLNIQECSKTTKGGKWAQL